MFDELSEQMKKDDAAGTSASERYMKWAAVAIASIVLFGGLYFGVSLVQ
jgi:hypothetical protein